jgi:hypothetical protein
MNVHRFTGYPTEIFCDFFPSATREKCQGIIPACYRDEGTSFSVSDVGHYVIVTKFIDKGALRFFNLPNPSRRTMALGSAQPLNRNGYQESSWGIKGGRVARKADNLTAICEPIV